MRELLEQHRPKPGETDLRGFEWYYLDRLCHAELLTLRHPAPAYSVAYSPDGKRLASASGFGGAMVKLWDVQTGKELLSLKGAGARVVFSPDGKRLASGAEDKTVKVWDAQTGQELLNLKVGGHVNSLAFSPNGHWLASDAGGMVTIYDATPLLEKP